MAANGIKSVFVCVVATLLTVVQTALPSANVDFRSMEENCILSFVVPRDKVKSSCDVEQRVTRRLNAMETKVSLYKQHMQELQEQLNKERELHRQQFEELSQRLSRTEPRIGSMDELFEKRVLALEEEVRKIRITVASSPKASQSSNIGEKPHGRGMGLGVVAGRTREEQEKAITNLVKTVVHSEVNKLFDNYTHYIGRYVRDQALAFNQVMNMVPRNDQMFSEHNLPPNWPGNVPNGNNLQQSSTPEPVDMDAQLLNQLEGIRSRLNSTGKRLVDHMQNMLSTVNVSAASMKNAPSWESSKAKDTTGASEVPQIKDSGLLDINDTASGDTNDTAGDHNITLVFTQLGNNSDDVDPQKYLHVPRGSGSGSSQGSKDTASAKSRMSYNADLNKLPDSLEDRTARREGVDMVNEDGGNNSGMQHDRSTGQWIQEWLRTEMQRILRQQVDEVVSLVSKHSTLVDTKLLDHERKFDQLEEMITADIKHLDQVVSGLKLEMTSVSQGLQTLYSRTEKAEELEETVMELKKNMSTESGSRLLTTMLDEQAKKVRKLERLTGVYQQSLEHYRNETKLEYRDLKDRLNKESSVLKGLQTDLYHNVTEHAKQLTDRFNTSCNKQMEEIQQRVQVMEDNTLLLQIDLSNFERQIKSKTSKLERDINKLNDDANDFKQKTRNLQKNLNSAMSEQNQLSNAVNSTTSKIQNLEIVLKLDVMDDWYPYKFEYMKSRTACFGDQYIRKSGFNTGRYVGVVLCSHNRYKILLGQDFTDVFKNIGDDSGMGEDHCQFVKARGMSKVRISPFKPSTETEPGYVRTHWGQEPRPELLNVIRPSPTWYECGVTIP